MDMRKFKIETPLLPLQAKMLGHELASISDVTSVDIDCRRALLQVEGEYRLYDIIEAAARQGITITPL